mgnify:CR=1 FL=1
MRIKGSDSEGNAQTQYTVFERRLADKLTYLDWKLSMVEAEEDFILMHSKTG